MASSSIAGIMGGEHSGCDEATTDVLIESALWEPLNVARTGRELGIITDARYRFERGVDPEFMVPGLELATRLVLDLCGGEPTVTEVVGYAGHTPKVVSFPIAEVKRLTGLDVPKEESLDILKRLGFIPEGSGELVDVSVPSWRPDIDGKADLVEEVMRIHGVDEIAPQPLTSHDAVNGKILTTLQVRTRAAKHALAVRGMMEAVTWSFIPAKHAEAFGGGQPALKLTNPIAADMSDMRPSLLPGLIAAAQRNADRGFGDVALFEVSGTYEGDTPEAQRRVAAGIRRGTAKLDGAGRHWAGNAQNVGVFDAKADAVAVLEASGAPVDKLRIEAGGPAWYHPGRSGAIKLGPKTVLGTFGEFHPKTLEALDVSGPLAGFEVFVDAIPEPKAKPTRTKPRLDLSGFQAVKRDFAFVVDRAVEAGSLMRAARVSRQEADHGRQRLRHIRRCRARRRQEVDRYRGFDPAGRQDADRRGFRGAGRPHRREREEADRRRAEGIISGRGRCDKEGALGAPLRPLRFCGDRNSPVDQSQRLFRVALAGNLGRRHGIADRDDVGAGERNLRRFRVLLQMADFPRARDRYDEVALMQHPSQRQLRGRHAFLLGQPLQRVDDTGVRRHVVGLKARQCPPPVVGTEFIRFVDGPSQQGAAQWAVRHETDAEFAQYRKYVRFRFAAPERVFALQGSDRMDGVRRRTVEALASESPSALTLPS